MNLVTVIIFIFKMVNEFGLSFSLLWAQLSGLSEVSRKQFQTLWFTVHKSKVLEKMQDSEKSVQCLSASLAPANII